jgi:hypothetical protein
VRGVLKIWFNTLLRLVAGTYFCLTSVYCLLAFLPYTYCAFVTAPPYAWMPWFVHHQAGLYWGAIGAALLANWRIPEPWRRKDPRLLVGLGLAVLAGAYLTFRPFLPGLADNRAAYWWSVAALLPLAGVAWWGPSCVQSDAPKQNSGTARDIRLFAYSTGVLTAFVVALLYMVAARQSSSSAGESSGFHAANATLAIWSVISHCAVALIVLSAVNLVYLAAAKAPKPQTARRGLMGVLIAAALATVLAGFLNSAMSFDGWAAKVYAVALAVALTLWGFSLVLPFLNRETFAVANEPHRSPWRQVAGTWMVIAVLVVLALASRRLIGGEDWNGFVESTSALILWVGLSLCVYRLRPARASYSAAAVLAVLLGSILTYEGLQATAIFWGKSLGSTDDEISRRFEDYGEQDASFQLAHDVLGSARSQSCGDLCRILREYTNVRGDQAHAEVHLVDALTPAAGARPNIFIFVIDSMRPDYLGAYNPQHVHYTPNLDALARDSVVFTNAYTQYAGTTLSEPAIWAGALLLHTHDPDFFENVDSLGALTRTDQYKIVVSKDGTLDQILPPSVGATFLDTDKTLWNQLEICSTVQQAEHFLDGHTNGQSVMFYTQPKNVHQFARNDVPSPSSEHWQSPAGLNPRITYEVHWVDGCLGGFFHYLKQRHMYDDSIIIVTSDHGDATGEFGRISHSTSIWPEIMRVPLIVHLPPKMRARLVYEPGRLSTLTDIVPSLYYVLGHRPIRQNPLYGRPLFAATQQELDSYPRRDIFLASDVRAVYGILTADGRYLYTTYDSPAQSYLFDLTADPNARHDILTPALKQRYDEEIIEHLRMIGDFYGYKPGVGSLLASAGQ